MITPAGVLIGAASIVGPARASVSLLTAIRAGKTSDDWAEAVRFASPVGALEKAIAEWKKRGVISNDLWSLLEPYFKSQSFSLAGQWSTDFLAELLGSLSDALLNQVPVKDWLKDADSIFAKFGASENRPRLYDGPFPKPRYADMVFRTNQATFQAAGTYAETFSRKWMAVAPYWLYSAIGDDRTREEHAALAGRVFRKDDARARRLLPPSNFNCRCSAIELDEEEVKDGGYHVSSGADIPAEYFPPEGWDTDRVSALVPSFLQGADLEPKEDVN